MVCSVALMALGVSLPAQPVSAHLELLGGATYNTYSLDWGPVDSKEGELPFNAGWGIYAGGQYWVTPSLATGGQVESMMGSGRDRWILADGMTEVTVAIGGQGTGYLATLATPLAASGRLDVTPFVAVGVYHVTADMKVSIAGAGAGPDAVTAKARLSSASRVGGKFGVTAGTQVGPGLLLSGQLAYRLVPAFQDLHLEAFGFEQDLGAGRGINISGFSAGLAISHCF